MKQIIIYIRENKIKIFIDSIIAIVVAVLVYNFNKISEFFILSTSKLSDGIADYYYSQVAKQTSIEPIDLISALNVLISMIILLFLISGLRNLERFITTKDSSITSEQRSKGNLIGFVVPILLIIGITTFALTFVVLPKAALNSYVKTANHKFNSELIILKPYIGEEKIEMLKSDWYLMRSADDFRNIDSELDMYFAHNNLIRDK